MAGPADDRWPVRGHRPQPAPEAGVLKPAPTRKEIADGVFQRVTTRLMQSEVVTGNLRRAADADAVAETRDRHLVGFVHDGRDRRAISLRDRHRDRIALDR